MHNLTSTPLLTMLNQFGLLVICVIACATALPSSVPFKDKEPKLHSFGADDWRKVYNETHNHVNSDPERSQRLGYTTGYGNGLQQGYPHSANGIGVYTPMKLDLGGVFLGALVGIGAILILPKLVNAFSGGNYGNYRSVDGDVPGLTEMLAKLDTYLGQNNIDTASCMQRAVCSYVKSSEKNMRSGAADQMDQIIHDISRNSIVEYMLDGTPIKEALENGRSDRVAKCEILYPGCQLDQETLLQMVKRFLPKN